MPRGTLISDESKRDFLEMFRQGLLRPEAAKELGYTGSQFRALCNPDSVHYDEVFARQYKEIVDSGEHDESRLERIRAEVMRRGLRDSDRLLEKLSLIYDPDWETLRTTRVDVTTNIETFVQENFKGLSSGQMREILAWVQDARSRSLPEGEIIDAIPREIEENGSSAD